MGFVFLRLFLAVLCMKRSGFSRFSHAIQLPAPSQFNPINFLQNTCCKESLPCYYPRSVLPWVAADSMIAGR